MLPEASAKNHRVERAENDREARYSPHSKEKDRERQLPV